MVPRLASGFTRYHSIWLKKPVRAGGCQSNVVTGCRVLQGKRYASSRRSRQGRRGSRRPDRRRHSEGRPSGSRRTPCGAFQGSSRTPCQAPSCWAPPKDGASALPSAHPCCGHGELRRIRKCSCLSVERRFILCVRQLFGM